jgi:hypothetical protein
MFTRPDAVRDAGFGFFAGAGVDFLAVADLTAFLGLAGFLRAVDLGAGDCFDFLGVLDVLGTGCFLLRGRVTGLASTRSD